MTTARDTIAAIATAPGAGGVGIVRLSGPSAKFIGETIAGHALRPRHAHYARFRDASGDTLDDGIALYFAAPASYTGEEVVELQGHGGPAVLDAVLTRACELGARRARPGEFSERAFLEGRLDLAQAEAVADLIAAADVRAARAARRALDGDFSRRVEALGGDLIAIRVHVEAAIDFADEPLDTLGGAALRQRFEALTNALADLLAAAERGRRLRDGLHAVIIGPPNAGKSSLLNALAGSERAIVTDIAGTTRDLLRETVRIDGVELHLVDTAGLREGGDVIEREGMRRARDELERADLALVVLDARDPRAGLASVADAIDDVPARLFIHNKIDLAATDAEASGKAADQADGNGNGNGNGNGTSAGSGAGESASPGADAANDSLDRVFVSARTGAGLDALHARLRALAQGDAADSTEGAFTARARHVDALRRAQELLEEARIQLDVEMLDLAAESLRLAHDTLGEITGRVHADDLLGHIFSSFCIGK